MEMTIILRTMKMILTHDEDKNASLQLGQIRSQSPVKSLTIFQFVGESKVGHQTWAL